MRRHKKPLAQNLDSLTDVLCNVVGILIILLAVTQVCAGKLVDGGLTKPPVSNLTSDELRRAEQKYKAIQDTLEDLRARWAKLEPQTADARAKFERIMKSIEECLRELASYKSPGNDTGELRQAIEERKKKKTQLERLLAKAQEELDRLNAEHGHLLAKKNGNTKTACLPDPRPAPEGAKPVIFICRYGRIVYLDADDLFNLMVGALRKALAGRNTLQLSDLFKVKEYFDTNDIGNQLFRWKILVWKYKSGEYTLKSQLIWRREDSGESLVQIRHANSDFVCRLRTLDKDKQYLRFLVWSDSFDTYLEARRIVDASSLAAGWIAYDTDEEFRYDLASRGGGDRAEKVVD